MGNSSSINERIDRQQRQINSQNNRINNLQKRNSRPKSKRLGFYR